MKKLLFILWVTFLLATPGISYGQVTITPTRTAVYPTLPAGYVPYVSAGVGTNLTASYYDEDIITSSNLLTNHSPNFSPRAATDVIVNTVAGTTTFTENDTYGNLQANWAAGGTYNVWEQGHIVTTESGGAVTGVTCTVCGYGYPASSSVPVLFIPSATNVFAVAHFNTNANGQLVSPGVVTSGGSGYGYAPSATVYSVLGRSGTIASNLVKDGSGNVVYTVNDAATAYNGFQQGDYITIQKQTVPSPAANCTSVSDGNFTLNGAATCTYETSDLPANLNSQQAILLTTGSGTASVSYASDTGRKAFLKLNGSYSLCLTYKIVSGSAPTVAINSARYNSVSGGASTLLSGNITTTTGGWTQSCYTATVSENGANPPGVITSTFTFPSNSTMYVGYLYLGESSSQRESVNVPANTYLSDAFIDNYLAFIGGPSQVGGYFTSRGWYGTESTPVLSMMVAPSASYATNVARQGATNFYNALPLTWISQLSLDAVLQTRSGKKAIPNIIVPTVTTPSDAALITQYFYGACSTTGGAYRCNEGYTSPWVGPGGTFPYIKFSIGNENWNYNSFTGQALVYQPYIDPSQTYGMAGYGTVSNAIYAAMQADSSYVSGYADFSLTAQLSSGNNQGLTMEAMCPLCTEFEEAPYNGSAYGAGTYNQSTALPALLAEPYYFYHGTNGALTHDVTNSGYSTSLGKSVKCSFYEYGNSSLSTNGFSSIAGQTQSNQFDGGLASGTATSEVYNGAENNGCYGTKVIFTYGQWHFPGPPTADGINYGCGGSSPNYDTCSPIWGIASDVEGEGTVRPEFIGNQVANKAVIGTPVTYTTSGVPTYNLTTTPSSSWVPNTNNIPCLSFRTEYNGSNDSIHIVNSCTSPYTVTIAGPYAPIGTINTYSMSSPNETDNNEDVALGKCTTASGTVTCVADNSEAFPLKTGDTAYQRQTSSAGCNGAFGPVTVSTPGNYTYTYSGSGTCTGGYVGNSPNLVSMVSSTSSNPVTVAPGNMTLLYSTSGGGGGTAATPVISPAAGAYAGSQSIAITDASPSPSIYYTTNGTTPTTASTLYSGAFAMASSGTVEALAVSSGLSNSAVASAAFTIHGATASPAFSVAAGTYTSAQSVAITDSTTGAAIQTCTTTGSSCIPGTSYSGAVAIGATETLCSNATAPTFLVSSTVCSAYVINVTQTATPVFTPGSESSASGLTIAIADATSGAVIYYTTNGTTPTTSSPVYSAPIAVSASQALKAVALASGDSISAVATATYTITGSCKPYFVMPAAGKLAITTTAGQASLIVLCQ